MKALFLEKLLFYGIILFLPTQIGKHFWPPFSFVEGIRIDYLSPTIYLTDILIIALLLLWATSFVSRLRSPYREALDVNRNEHRYPNHLTINAILLLIFGLTLIFSILQSQSPMAGLYKLLKLVEFAFLGFYIAATVNWKADYQKILTFLAVGIFFESLLAVAQFIQQASLGGMFWFFGERTFSGQTPGIANANLDGRLLLRPYGTFPHPNVLAGYLIIAMTLIESGIRNQESGIRKLLLVVSLILGTIALFLTLSRVAIVLWFLIGGRLLVKKFILHKQSFPFSFEKRNSYFISRSLAVLVLIGSIGIISYTPLPSRFTSLLSVDKESLLARHELNAVAIDMFKQSPLFGVGLNNFLVHLPEYSREAGSRSAGQRPTSGSLRLQPVHNIFLLALAETGIAGLAFFLWFLGKTYNRIRKKNLMIHNSLFIILFMSFFLGLFDHYLLTLQQGQLLLALVLGLCWSKNA